MVKEDGLLSQAFAFIYFSWHIHIQKYTYIDIQYTQCTRSGFTQSIIITNSILPYQKILYIVLGNKKSDYYFYYNGNQVVGGNKSRKYSYFRIQQNDIRRSHMLAAVNLILQKYYNGKIKGKRCPIFTCLLYSIHTLKECYLPDQI